MRRWMPLTVPVFAASLTTAIIVGQALGNQETYASVRDCMRSVTDVEREAQSQGSTITPEEGRLLAQARDLCMQTRYDGVREALEAVAGPSDS